MERSAEPRPPAPIDQTIYCPQLDRNIDVEQCFACSWSRLAKRAEHVLPVVCTWRRDPHRRFLDAGLVVY